MDIVDLDKISLDEEIVANQEEFVPEAEDQVDCKKVALGLLLTVTFSILFAIMFWQFSFLIQSPRSFYARVDGEEFEVNKSSIKIDLFYKIFILLDLLDWRR